MDQTQELYAIQNVKQKALPFLNLAESMNLYSYLYFMASASVSLLTIWATVDLFWPMAT